MVRNGEKSVLAILKCFDAKYHSSSKTMRFLAVSDLVTKKIGPNEKVEDFVQKK